MSENTVPVELTITEQRIRRTKVPMWFGDTVPRICLLQLQSAETVDTVATERRQDLINGFRWDHEDYDEMVQGVRPDGTNPEADVRVCGMGNCTVRIFELLDGSDIQSGECVADNYCLREKFAAVDDGATVESRTALYRDLIDTCGLMYSQSSAGSFCPQLDCELSAGVSIDMVPGTAGNCLKDVSSLQM